MRFCNVLGALLAVCVGAQAFGLGSVEVETGFAAQSRNDVRIPSTGGTDVSIAQGALVPFVRVQATVKLAERHELRALWAPYAVEKGIVSTAPLNFNGQNFAANTPIDTKYQFNSYRLTYRYRFVGGAADDKFELWGGLTAKIRDAYIRFTQGAVTTTSANVGFVPLLHVSARFRFGDQWSLLADIDGLAAPQGRAFDVYAGVRYTPCETLYFGAGYRTLEGGASNDTIHNFNWVHYLTLTAGARW